MRFAVTTTGAISKTYSSAIEGYAMLPVKTAAAAITNVFFILILLITKKYKKDMHRFRGISPHTKNLFLIFNLWYAHTTNL
jgi:hypothetical protein